MKQLRYCIRLLGDIGVPAFSFFPGGLRDLKLLMGPGVYLLRSHAEPLYVGMAKNVLARVTDEAHTACQQAFKEAVFFDVICAHSEEHARGLETELIRKLQPKYNVRGTWAGMPEIKQFARDFTEALTERLG